MVDAQTAIQWSWPRWWHGEIPWNQPMPPFSDCIPADFDLLVQGISHLECGIVARVISPVGCVEGDGPADDLDIRHDIETCYDWEVNPMVPSLMDTQRENVFQPCLDSNGNPMYRCLDGEGPVWRAQESHEDCQLPSSATCGKTRTSAYSLCWLARTNQFLDVKYCQYLPKPTASVECSSSYTVWCGAGTCNQDSRCSCPDPWDGDNCEIRLDTQWSAPAWPSGTTDCTLPRNHKCGTPTRTRQVTCILTGTGKVVANDDCNHLSKPETTQECAVITCQNGGSCNTSGQCACTRNEWEGDFCDERVEINWRVVNYDECQVSDPKQQSCGPLVQTGKLQCYRLDDTAGTIENSYCEARSGLVKPSTTRNCIDEFTLQPASIKCQNGGVCDTSGKCNCENSINEWEGRLCNDRVAIDWRVVDYGECYFSNPTEQFCGKQLQAGKLQCYRNDKQDTIADSHCENRSGVVKPSTIRDCIDETNNNELILIECKNDGICNNDQQCECDPYLWKGDSCNDVVQIEWRTTDWDDLLDENGLLQCELPILNNNNNLLDENADNDDADNDDDTNIPKCGKTYAKRSVTCHLVSDQTNNTPIPSKYCEQRELEQLLSGTYQTKPLETKECQGQEVLCQNDGICNNNLQCQCNDDLLWYGDLCEKVVPIEWRTTDWEDLNNPQDLICNLPISDGQAANDPNAAHCGKTYRTRGVTCHLVSEPSDDAVISPHYCRQREAEGLLQGKYQIKPLDTKECEGDENIIKCQNNGICNDKNQCDCIDPSFASGDLCENRVLVDWLVPAWKVDRNIFDVDENNDDEDDTNNEITCSLLFTNHYCGQQYQQRDVQCIIVNTNEVIDDSYCTRIDTTASTNIKPLTIKPCGINNDIEDDNGNNIINDESFLFQFNLLQQQQQQQQQNNNTYFISCHNNGQCNINNGQCDCPIGFNDILCNSTYIPEYKWKYTEWSTTCLPTSNKQVCGKQQRTRDIIECYDTISGKVTLDNNNCDIPILTTTDNCPNITPICENGTCNINDNTKCQCNDGWDGLLCNMKKQQEDDTDGEQPTGGGGDDGDDSTNPPVIIDPTEEVEWYFNGYTNCQPSTPFSTCGRQTRKPIWICQTKQSKIKLNELTDQRCLALTTPPIIPSIDFTSCDILSPCYNQGSCQESNDSIPQEDIRHLQCECLPNFIGNTCNQPNSNDAEMIKNMNVQWVVSNWTGCSVIVNNGNTPTQCQEYYRTRNITCIDITNNDNVIVDNQRCIDAYNSLQTTTTNILKTIPSTIEKCFLFWPGCVGQPNTNKTFDGRWMGEGFSGKDPWGNNADGTSTKPQDNTASNVIQNYNSIIFILTAMLIILSIIVG